MPDSAPIENVDQLVATARAGELPRHIAIIMDGNGRWAQKRHLPAAAGHRAGAKKVREISEACVEHVVLHGAV